MIKILYTVKKLLAYVIGISLRCRIILSNLYICILLEKENDGVLEITHILYVHILIMHSIR